MREFIFVAGCIAWMTLYLFGAVSFADALIGPIQATWQWFVACWLIMSTMGLQRHYLRRYGKTLGFA